MTILALESDPTLAAAVQHVVCDLVRAKLTLVQSFDLAVQALHRETPDLILLPALVSPAEEGLLLTLLHTLPKCAHVEVLTTPVLHAPEEPETVARRGWRRWGSRRASTRPCGPDELRLFAQRLGWSLQGVRQRKQLTQECSPQDVMTVEADMPESDPPNLTTDDSEAPAHQPTTNAAIDTPPPFDDALETIMEPYRPSLQQDLMGDVPAGHDDTGDLSEPRNHVRVSGPFDGLRLGAIETPVRIRDLSVGGCFVDSLVEAKVGRHVSLGLLVPGEDWITVTGEVIRWQPEFGFAMRFVELPDATRACLERVVASRCLAHAARVSA